MKSSIYLSLLICASLASCTQTKEADAYGNFEATETIVSAEANGKIKSILLSEGDVISAGTLVAEIDPSLLAQQKISLRQISEQLKANHQLLRRN